MPPASTPPGHRGRLIFGCGAIRLRQGSPIAAGEILKNPALEALRFTPRGGRAPKLMHNRGRQTCRVLIAPILRPRPTVPAGQSEAGSGPSPSGIDNRHPTPIDTLVGFLLHAGRCRETAVLGRLRLLNSHPDRVR